jgi:hypothetical protein
LIEPTSSDKLRDMATPLPEATLQTAIDADAYEQALNLAKDSLAKASTPEPFSHSKTSNWVAKGGGLPAYIQHIAHDLMEKRGMPESRAIAMAIGIVKRWARGGGNVDANTKAAAAKAVAEWEALKAKAHAKSATNASAQTDEFDPTLYLSALEQERESLDMAVFNEELHPRNHGKFVKKLGEMKPGNALLIGGSHHPTKGFMGGVQVRRDGTGFEIHKHKPEGGIASTKRFTKAEDVATHLVGSDARDANLTDRLDQEDKRVGLHTVKDRLNQLGMKPRNVGHSLEADLPEGRRLRIEPDNGNNRAVKGVKFRAYDVQAPDEGRKKNLVKGDDMVKALEAHQKKHGGYGDSARAKLIQDRDALVRSLDLPSVRANGTKRSEIRQRIARMNKALEAGNAK